MKINISPFVIRTLLNFLEWAKCFLDTYEEYPRIYDLVDTPKHVLLSLNVHLSDPMFPRPLLP